MNIYTVMSRYEPIPLTTFVDFDEMIRYIRRRKFDKHKIYETVANDWNEFTEVRDVSETVYTKAYNEN